MNFPNVMESPIDHNKEDITIEEVEDILEYNLNDVLATYEFYKKSADKIALRKKLMNKYNIPCISWNNGKIGEQLILKLYCQKTGLDIWDVKERRTYRPRIELSKCVPDITFESKEFNDLLNYFKSLTISSTKGEANKQLIFKGIKYDYGSGGVHACIKPGIYESNDKFIIKSCDVASLYPNLAIQYDFYIEHLGKEFLDVYKGDIVDVRMAEKAKGKNGDKAIVDGFKEAANVPYGKSNEVFSFLYDPLYTMKTTIHGQLLMSKLCEMLSNIEDSQILMVNTDGLEIMIPVYKQDEYTSICKKWEELTRLTLEFSDYKKLWVRDINNYGCIDFKGKIKNKGAFEVDKVIGSEPAYHKDNSFRIIPLAIQEYFTKGIPVEETIKNHRDIYDFCGRQKFDRDSYGETHEILDNNIFVERQQRNVRYYISNPGKTFIKQYKKGTSEFVHKNYQVTIFNKFVEKPFNEYSINYSFYINECKKIIDVVEDKQLMLF